jgi:DNA-binding PadR family transcriptional regulator
MNKPISVGEICAMRQFGSSSNIHHILHKLKELGMIFLHCSDEGGRIKKINLAPSGVAYFQDVEDQIDKALKN